MPTKRVEKVIVCSECGTPLTKIPTSIGDAEESFVEHEEFNTEEDILSGETEDSVDTIYEPGPVCDKCAGIR